MQLNVKRWQNGIEMLSADSKTGCHLSLNSVVLSVSHRGQETLPFTGGGHFTVITEDITDITHH